MAKIDERVERLCGIAVPAVTYIGVGGMRSLPEILFGMTRLPTLLLSLGPAKLVRYRWIWIRKQWSAS